MMATIVNGFAPGEAKVRRFHPKKRDEGHSVVRQSTRRQGNSWRFCYSLTCECGKQFQSTRSRDSLFYRWEAHRK